MNQLDQILSCVPPPCRADVESMHSQYAQPVLNQLQKRWCVHVCVCVCLCAVIVNVQVYVNVPTGISYTQNCEQLSYLLSGTT